MSIPNSFNPMGTLGAGEPFVQPVLKSNTAIDESKPHSCSMSIAKRPKGDGTYYEPGNSYEYVACYYVFDGRIDTSGGIATSYDQVVDGFDVCALCIKFSRPVKFNNVKFLPVGFNVRSSHVQFRYVDATGEEIVCGDMKSTPDARWTNKWYSFPLTMTEYTNEIRIFSDKPDGNVSNWAFQVYDMQFEGVHKKS